MAEQLSVNNRLDSHLRDELNIDPNALSRPLQAAWISALSLAFFAAIPLVALLIAPAFVRIPMIAVVSLVSLGGLGALGAHHGGAPRLRAAVRVTVGGIVAMGLSAAIGRLLGVSVS